MIDKLLLGSVASGGLSIENDGAAWWGFGAARATSHSAVVVTAEHEI